MATFIDAYPATSRALIERLDAADGHRTALQVAAGRIRGFEQHLVRLDDASHSLFAEPAPLAIVREAVTRALVDVATDATLRIEIFIDREGRQRVLVTVSAADPRPRTAHRLDVVLHVRILPGIDHTALGSNGVLDRASRRDGFDGVVIVDPGGLVTEVADGSLGLVSGRRVIWPERPGPEGIGRALLDPLLVSEGITAVTLPVPLADLALFDAAFVVCPRGIAPVASIGPSAWAPRSPRLLTSVMDAYDDAPTS